MGTPKPLQRSKTLVATRLPMLLTIGVLLVGCSKVQPVRPQRALDDASAAAQRAAEAMKGTSNPETDKDGAAKPVVDGVQADNSGRTQ
jgi:hypothetical protein